MNRLKISIKLILIAIGLLLILQVPVFAVTGKSTAVNVRVRKAASANSEVIELLDENDVVEILGKEDNWYKVNFKGTIGYVSCDFINANGKVEESKSEENNSQNNETNNQEKNEQNNDNKVDENKKEENIQQEQNTENQSSNTDEQNTETAPVAIPEITNKVYKMADITKVNVLPVITSEYIGEVKKGSEVSVIINAGLWVYIQSTEVSGWVRIDKLSAEDVVASNEDVQKVETQEEQPKEEPKQEQKEEYTPKTMYVKATAVNVRSQSNISSESVDALEMNSQVKVIGEENGWYKVEFNGKNGYIRQDLLSNKKTEVTSRSNDLDRSAAATQAKTEQSQATQTSNNAQQTTEVTVVPAQQAAPAQTQQATPAAATSSGVTGTDIANYAKQFVGCRYVYGASGPSSFDCSGLTMYVYKHFGYNLSHSSKTQATQGKKVAGDLQPGDILVFSNNGKTVGHVGIYLGNDKFVHASDSSTGVIISNLSDRWNKSKYWGARRIL